MVSTWEENRILKHQLKEEQEKNAFLLGTDNGYLLAEKEETINHLKKLNRIFKTNMEKARARRDIWEKKYYDKSAESRTLKEKNRKLNKDNKELKEVKGKLDKAEERIRDLEADKEALEREVARLNALYNIDSTNSGIPTSRTPLHKNKVIPNGREKTGRKIGGQAGHKKHEIRNVDDKEIDENIIHKPDECPKCGGTLEVLDEDEKAKDELDIKVVVVKKRHHFPMCQCKECGKRLRRKIPVRLKEQTQYGNEVDTLIMSQLDEGFVSMERTAGIIKGMTEGELTPVPGYMAKVQARASRGLRDFVKSIATMCCKKELLYWDDTVIFINTARACLRFYGDEYLALYKAHMKKDKEGLDEDGILKMLPSEAVVVHDHNTVNYNPDYIFKNAECMAHLQRDIQKAIEQLRHKSAKEMKELISGMILEREKLSIKGKTGFSKGEIKKFEHDLEGIISKWRKENKKDEGRYFANEELALINRIEKYKESNFLWIYNFLIPVTNNLSERSLRMAKSKLKISGQFQNIETARYFADIKTYTETCKRNGILPYEALRRLTEGNPYTLEEVLEHGRAEREEKNKERSA